MTRDWEQTNNGRTHVRCRACDVARLHSDRTFAQKTGQEHEVFRGHVTPRRDNRIGVQQQFVENAISDSVVRYPEESGGLKARAAPSDVNAPGQVRLRDVFGQI